ncbi:MAG: hypothetical protein IJY07_03910 [Clostridia bacterium]|nr:hypothetical protein [Clostridia bacterium]
MEIKMTNLFELINSECEFSEDLISTGITQLGKANLCKKSLYYQSFMCISTGLERLMKIIIILNEYYKNNYLLTQKQLKQKGHNLCVLFKECESIGKAYDIEVSFSEPKYVYNTIIEILSDFSNTGNNNRYYNLNYISEANTIGFELPKDATHRWYESLDYYIYENKISNKAKEKIVFQSQSLGNILDTCCRVNFTSENNTSINTTKIALFEIQKQSLCARYRCLFVSQIVRYLSTVLNHISHKLHLVDKENIPFTNEYFTLFCNKDSYLLTRKTFNNC